MKRNFVISAMLMALACMLSLSDFARAQEQIYESATPRQQRVEKKTLVTRTVLDNGHRYVDVHEQQPFTCPPTVEFYFYKGNSGKDQDRAIGGFTHKSFTAEGFDSPLVRVYNFQSESYTNAQGTTTIGRPGTNSWVDLKVERKGTIGLKYWLNGVTLQTGDEFHLSGGAFEGSFYIHSNARRGYCVNETWSIPEGFAYSQLSKRVNNGTLAGRDSLMFDQFCHWLIPGWGGKTHLLINNLEKNVEKNEVIWHPFEVKLPGTDMWFNIGWLKVTLCETTAPPDGN